MDWRVVKNDLFIQEGSMPARLYLSHKIVTYGPQLALRDNLFGFWDILIVQHLNSQKISLWKSGFPARFLDCSPLILGWYYCSPLRRRPLQFTTLFVSQSLRLSSSSKKTHVWVPEFLQPVWLSHLPCLSDSWIRVFLVCNLWFIVLRWA